MPILTSGQHHALKHAAAHPDGVNADDLWRGTADSRLEDLHTLVHLGYLRRVDEAYVIVPAGRTYLGKRSRVKAPKYSAWMEMFTDHVIEVGPRYNSSISTQEPVYDVFLDGEEIGYVEGFQSTPYNVHGRIRYDMATRREWVWNGKGYGSASETRVDAITREVRSILNKRAREASK